MTCTGAKKPREAKKPDFDCNKTNTHPNFNWLNIYCTYMSVDCDVCIIT